MKENITRAMRSEIKSVMADATMRRITKETMKEESLKDKIEEIPTCKIPRRLKKIKEIS
jgi:hypothetical protein